MRGIVSSRWIENSLDVPRDARREAAVLGVHRAHAHGDVAVVPRLGLVHLAVAVDLLRPQAGPGHRVPGVLALEAVQGVAVGALGGAAPEVDVVREVAVAVDVDLHLHVVQPVVVQGGPRDDHRAGHVGGAGGRGDDGDPGLVQGLVDEEVVESIGAVVVVTLPAMSVTRA